MKKKVLIADDEADIREIIRFFLEDEGFDVIEASTGEEVLDLAENLQPNIIILDMIMPGIDGFEIIKQLKDNSLTSLIPVIIVSVLSTRDVDDALMFREAIADYICKPFLPQQLISSIRNVLALTQKDKDTKKKILIADDEPDIVSIISKHLTDAGYISLEASDGVSALNIAKQKKPDLIILDLKMPHIDGFGVIQQLKKDKETSFIPIIVLTGVFLGDQERNLVLKLGASKFISKPFSNQDLLMEIKNILCDENVF